MLKECKYGGSDEEEDCICEKNRKEVKERLRLITIELDVLMKEFKSCGMKEEGMREVVLSVVMVDDSLDEWKRLMGSRGEW